MSTASIGPGAEPGVDEREWLAEVLTRRIPLGGAMELSIERLDGQGVELFAPLAPNVNDKGTAFGGALAAAMILAGWALPRLLLRRAKLESDLVIGRCAIRFAKPVEGAFSVRCDWPKAELADQFIAQARDRGWAKLELAPEAICDTGVAATLLARYAALGKREG